MELVKPKQGTTMETIGKTLNPKPHKTLNPKTVVKGRGRDYKYIL